MPVRPRLLFTFDQDKDIADLDSHGEGPPTLITPTLITAA